MAADSDALDDWLELHGPALLLLARQWTPNLLDAEDVVQEAFVRFWRSRATATDPRAYLYACVRHAALDLMRGERRRRRREQAVQATVLSSTLLECPVDREEQRLRLEVALESLPAEQREVLVMKMWGDLTFTCLGSAERRSRPSPSVWSICQVRLTSPTASEERKKSIWRGLKEKRSRSCAAR